jgi:hypothetical protein
MTTLTLRLSDELAKQLLALPEAERDQLANEALAALLPDTTAETHTDADDTPLPDDILAMFGFAKGEPGSIGDDVEGYIRAMREEWDEREAQWERPFYGCGLRQGISAVRA